MPLITNTDYRSPTLFFNGHLETLIPSLFKRTSAVSYERERITLPDGDFLDLDWVRKGSDRLIVVSHGLEGSSDSVYVRTLANLASQLDFDILAWNCRSCSGELNLLPRLYYHGDTEDIRHVIRHAMSVKSYRSIALVGFSLGANISLKTVGSTDISQECPVKVCVGVSAPCDLGSASAYLDKPINMAYKLYFKRLLYRKLKAKLRQFPGWVSLDSFRPGRPFRDVDEEISAPINGFSSAAEFYYHSSSRHFVGGTTIPTLLLNALNDPVLTRECHPVELADTNPKLFIELPRRGGHVGFPSDLRLTSWVDRRILRFIGQYI